MSVCTWGVGGGKGGITDLDGGARHPPVDRLDVPGEAVGGDAVVPAAVGEVAGRAVVAGLGQRLVALRHEPVATLQGVRGVHALAHARVVEIVCTRMESDWLIH